MGIAIPEDYTYNQRVEVPEQSKPNIVGKCVVIVCVEALYVR